METVRIFKVKTWKLRELLDLTLMIIVSLVVYSHFQNPRSDFRLFYDAATELLNGFSPWLAATHPPDQVFLNGAGTLSILTFFTMFKFETAIALLRFLIVIVTAIFVWDVTRKSDKNLRTALILLALTSIPLRANLEYGAIGLLMFFGWYFALKSEFKNSYLLKAVALAITLDFKPQLFWVNLFLVLALPKIGKVIFFSTLILPWIIESLFLKRILIFDWIEVLLQRTKLAQSDNLQMDLACILRLMGINNIFSLTIFLLSICCYVFFLFKYNRLKIVLDSPLLLLGFSVAFNVFLHPTDLTVFLPFLLILLTRLSNSSFMNLVIVVFGLGLMNVWSNNYKFAIAQSVISILVFIMVVGKANLLSKLSGTLILCAPICFVYFSQFGDGWENLLRNSMNYFGFLSIVLFVTFRSDARETNLLMIKKV
jgi:hypothetical protein